MSMLVNMNGAIIPPEAATVSIFDHGFLFGDSIYEVLRTVDGELFMWDAHWKRLLRSAAYLGLAMPLTEEEVKQRTLATMAAAGNPENYVRIIITRGAGEIHIDPTKASAPQTIIIVKPYVRYPEENYRDGIRLAIVRQRRNHPSALDPAAKTGNYLNSVLALVEATGCQASDAVMLSHEGFVTEATTSNIFFVARGRLCTPSLETGILSGITRGLVARAAELAGVELVAGSFTAGDIMNADEAFVSSTLKDIMPIRELFNANDGTSWRRHPPLPGPVTARLMQQWTAVTAEAMGRS